MSHTLSVVWRRVFADSSGYFALAHEPDESHRRAVAALKRLVADRYRFFTTNSVLAELHALLVNRVDRNVALAVLNEIEMSRITTIVRVRQQDELRAREILAQYDDKEFSLTDAISFAVMERLGITMAFAFDHHFAQFGWQLTD
jgi:predicted nucleic acid-binding protein